MRKKLAGALLACAFVCFGARPAAAITWVEQEVECPVCHTKNVFLVPGSWGSYIYEDESKFELVFWPFTADASYHSCRKCRFTAFMGDFKEAPKEKHAELLKLLEGVRLEPRKKGGERTYYKNAVYLDIPIIERLLVAQKVYEVLGRDAEFWCYFQRVLGHHYEAEGRRAEADEARRRALGLAEKMLAEEARAGQRKELLYISGAMRHFLRDDAGALRDFREAQGLKYRHTDMKPEQAESYDGFLSDLLKQYFEKLRAKPGKKKAARGHGR